MARNLVWSRSVDGTKVLNDEGGTMRAMILPCGHPWMDGMYMVLVRRFTKEQLKSIFLEADDVG